MKSRAYWLHGLHFILALSLPLVVTLLIGCMKAKATQADLGAEVPNTTINEILNKATSSGDLTKLKVGQYVDFINTRRIETADVDTTLGSHRVEVIDALASATKTHFTFKITDSVRNGAGSFQTVITQDSLDVAKVASSSVHAAEATVVKTTFHHLQETDSVIDVPDAVKARVGCGGVASCQIPVHSVHFDMVNWQDETNYTKTTLDLTFATVTPYLPFGSGMQQLTGVLINDCRATYVPVDSVPVYVRDCMTLDDFQN